MEGVVVFRVPECRDGMGMNFIISIKLLVLDNFTDDVHIFVVLRE